MCRVAVCDDELKFLKMIEQELTLNFHKYHLGFSIDCFSSGHDLIERVEKRKSVYDIIFLDIEMPIINGFLVAEKLRSLCGSSFMLLFATNMEGEAVRGYKYQAFRFIVKSRLKEELEEAVRSILRIKNKLMFDEQNIEFKYKYEDSFDFIKVRRKEVIFMEVRRRRVFLVTLYGEYELLTFPLLKYQEMLGGENFIILSRSCLVNLEHVEHISGNFLRLTGGKRVCIGYSKTAQADFRKKYMLYKGANFS